MNRHRGEEGAAPPDSARSSPARSATCGELQQFLVNEPLNLLEAVLGAEIGDSGARLRVRSWATRSPVVDLIAQRLPQTLTVVGISYLVAILIAVPVGVLSSPGPC